MINRRTFTIFGNEIERQISYDVTKPKVLYEEAQNPSNYFTLNDRIMSRHILMLGGAGSGKTNVFNLTVSQLRDDDNDNTEDIFIVFDTKGDFSGKLSSARRSCSWKREKISGK